MSDPADYVDQNALIAAIVHNTELLQGIRPDIDPRIWRSKAQRYTVKLILALFDQNKVSPRRATLLRAVDRNVDKEEFKAEVYEVIRSAYSESPEESKGTFSDELLVKVKRLSRLSAGEKYIELVGEGKFDLADKEIDRVRTIGSGSKGYDFLLAENYNEICDPKIAAYNRKGIVPTGFPIYDQYLRGGYGYPELHAICADSGMGKSRFVNNIAAHNIKAGRKVCYFSFEMDEPVVATRTWQVLNSLTVEQVKTPTGAQEVAKTAKVLNSRGAEFHIKRFPENAISFDHLEGYILRLGIQFDLIIVDYIDMMVNSANVKNMNEWKAEAAKFAEGRRFSGNVGSACVTVMQCTDVEPGVIITQNNARGSRGKIDCLDTFCSINSDENDEANEEFTFYNGKNRYNKRSSYTRMGYDSETLRVYELEQ